MTQLDIRGTVVGSAALAIKAPCLVASTSNITLSGAQTIDGVLVGNNQERVLVLGQSSQTQNGIYIASTSAWVYAADWTNNNNVADGTMVLVSSGTANAGLQFVQTCTDSPIIIGTSLVTFSSLAALALASQSATSTTSLTVGTGTQTLTIQAGKNFVPGQWVLIYNTATPSNRMVGQVTSYSGTTLVVSVTATGGSGTLSAWTIVLNNSIAGASYVTGPASSVSGHLATFGGTNGQVIADGGAAGALANLSTMTAQYLVQSAIGFGINMLNGAVAASVAGSALTLAIKTLAGNDPSATDPVWFVFRSATAGTSTPTVIEVTAALSLTIPSGATLGSSSATPFKAWLVATNNAGTVALAVINCFDGNNIYPLGGWGIAGSVVTPIANSSKTFYGPGNLSNVPYSVLSNFSYEAGSTLATAGTYSATPTRQDLLRPGVWLPGGLVQSNYAPFSTTATNATTATYTPSVTAPTSTSAAAGPTQAITPSSSAHLLRVRGQIYLGAGNIASNVLTGFLTQDAAITAIAAATSPSALASSTGLVSIPLFYQAQAATSNSTTFKMFGYSSASNCNVNTAANTTAFFGGNVSTHLLVEELAT